MHPVIQRVSRAGVTLAFQAWGEPGTPARPRETVVLLHGFPDSSALWARVAPLLAKEFRVIVPDMRGCGDSTPVSGAKHYRYEELLADLYAIIDAVSPEKPVHVVGHDWGGIYPWHALVDAGGIARIRSFTTMAPPVEAVGLYIRGRLLRPTPRNLMQASGQALRNALMFFFAMPLLPTLMWKSGLGLAVFRRMVKLLERGLILPERAGMAADAVRFLGIYRENLLRRALLPAPLTINRVPVHALMATRDPFLPPAVFESLPAWVRDCSSSTVDASHWAPLSQPQAVARAVSRFVNQSGEQHA